MSFSCEVQLLKLHGRDVARVDIPLTVGGLGGGVEHPFRLDTGCDTTMVSEDVAIKLGLPAGGASVWIRGSTGSAPGRLVPVTFRFPPDEISGLPEPSVNSTWIVTTGQTDLALLSLHEVHSQFSIGTDDAYMYFAKR